MSKFLPLMVSMLLFVSCDNNKFDIVKGKLYLISTIGENGCIRFDDFSHNCWRGSFYVDNGRLLASKHIVTLTNGKVPKLIDGVGNELTVLKLEEFKPQKFNAYDKTWLYTDSVYPVKVEKDMKYAKSVGYWASYPDNNISYLKMFLTKRSELHKKELDLTMDVYMPQDEGEALRPLLVLVHGGAFFIGDKSSIGYPEWARYFAGLGYTVVSVNYRMGFYLNSISVERAGLRAVQDVKAAIGYIVRNKDKYRVDPDRVFVAGTSAGGITALNVAFMRNSDNPASAKGDGNEHNPPPLFSIRAIGNLWGAVEDTTILSNSATAILSVHSKWDPVVPFEEGYPFKEVFGNNVIFPIMYGSKVITSIVGSERAKLIEYNIPGKHTLHIDNDSNVGEHLNHRFQEIKDAMRDFFSEHMLPHPVRIEHVKNTNVFRADIKDVDVILWEVEGGIVINQQKGKVKVLLFPEVKEKSITASGKYKSGLTFNHTLKINS